MCDSPPPGRLSIATGTGTYVLQVEGSLKKLVDGTPLKSSRSEAANLHAAAQQEEVTRNLKAMEAELKSWSYGNEQLQIFDPEPMDQEIADRLLGIDRKQRTLLKSENGVFGPSLLSFCFFV